MTHPQRVMVITGASSGFGRELALLAARAGYRVVVTARRAERLEELVGEITAAGGTALALPGDVTDEAHQQALVETTLKRYGRIDMLVNNAGIPLKGGFADETLDALRSQWQTNVTTIITLTRRALPALIGTQGVVVNIGSVAGHFSVPGWGLYFPSKVAVASISDALRRELGPLGVKVCLVEPGPYNTEFSRRAGKAEGGYAAIDVAAAILRLGDRPRRRVIMPFWFAPLLAIGSTLARSLPGLVDLVFALRAKQEQRRMEREEALRHNRG